MAADRTFQLNIHTVADTAGVDAVTQAQQAQTAATQATLQATQELATATQKSEEQAQTAIEKTTRAIKEQAEAAKSSVLSAKEAAGLFPGIDMSGPSGIPSALHKEVLEMIGQRDGPDWLRQGRGLGVKDDGAAAFSGVHEDQLMGQLRETGAGVAAKRQAGQDESFQGHLDALRTTGAEVAELNKQGGQASSMFGKLGGVLTGVNAKALMEFRAGVRAVHMVLHELAAVGGPEAQESIQNLSDVITGNLRQGFEQITGTTVAKVIDDITRAFDGETLAMKRTHGPLNEYLSIADKAKTATQELAEALRVLGSESKDIDAAVTAIDNLGKALQEHALAEAGRDRDKALRDLDHDDKYADDPEGKAAAKKGIEQQYSDRSYDLKTKGGESDLEKDRQAYDLQKQQFVSLDGQVKAQEERINALREAGTASSNLDAAGQQVTAWTKKLQGRDGKAHVSSDESGELEEDTTFKADQQALADAKQNFAEAHADSVRLHKLVPGGTANVNNEQEKAKLETLKQKRLESLEETVRQREQLGIKEETHDANADETLAAKTADDEKRNGPSQLIGPASDPDALDKAVRDTSAAMRGLKIGSPEYREASNAYKAAVLAKNAAGVPTTEDPPAPADTAKPKATPAPVSTDTAPTATGSTGGTGGGSPEELEVLNKIEFNTRGGGSGSSSSGGGGGNASGDGHASSGGKEADRHAAREAMREADEAMQRLRPHTHEREAGNAHLEAARAKWRATLPDDGSDPDAGTDKPHAPLHAAHHPASPSGGGGGGGGASPAHEQLNQGAKQAAGVTGAAAATATAAASHLASATADHVKVVGLQGSEQDRSGKGSRAAGGLGGFSGDYGSINHGRGAADATTGKDMATSMAEAANRDKIQLQHAAQHPQTAGDAGAQGLHGAATALLGSVNAAVDKMADSHQQTLGGVQTALSGLQQMHVTVAAAFQGMANHNFQQSRQMGVLLQRHQAVRDSLAHDDGSSTP